MVQCWRPVPLLAKRRRRPRDVIRSAGPGRMIQRTRRLTHRRR